MKRKISIVLRLLFVILIGSSCSQKDSSLKNYQPNIIYILADDMGYGDLQCLNPESKIPTPNMDRIVEEGVHFTDAHTNSSVCTPTRYGILTGRYAWRTRLKDGVLWGYSSSLIEPGRETVATYMKKKNYTTACIGKWHLGLDWQKLDTTKEIPDIKWEDKIAEDFVDNVDYSKYINGGPSDHGFDYSLIIPASLDMSPYLYVRNGWAVEAPTEFTFGKSQAKDGRGVFWREGKVSPSFDFYNVLPNFIDTACNFIAEKAKLDKPFFLYLPLPAPHTPWLPTDKYNNNSTAGKYGDFVNMVDHQVGKVVQAVEGAGIDENTLIIVTSDNGSDWRPSDIEETGHHANYIFKGRKADIYEAGHRIPFIARWKGIIPEGSSSDEIMCTTDLLATIAGIFGEPLTDKAGEDSYNLWPAFIGKAGNKPIREATVHHSLDGHFSIRKGKWKLTTHLGSGGFSQPVVITPQEGEATGTLYDIENDAKEQNNLYLQYPQVVEELSLLLEAYKEKDQSRK